MKRKYFSVVLFLTLTIFLSGCGVVTDEEKVRDVIDEYFLAINAQDWDEAKRYCVYNSDIYYETCRLEDYIDSSFPSVVDIIFNVDIFNITVTGDYASAYIDGSLTIITDGLSETDDSSGHLYLQKVSNSWKLDYWR